MHTTPFEFLFHYILLICVISSDCILYAPICAIYSLHFPYSLEFFPGLYRATTDLNIMLCAWWSFWLWMSFNCTVILLASLSAVHNHFPTGCDTFFYQLVIVPCILRANCGITRLMHWNMLHSSNFFHLFPNYSSHEFDLSQMAVTWEVGIMYTISWLGSTKCDSVWCRTSLSLWQVLDKTSSCWLKMTLRSSQDSNLGPLNSSQMLLPTEPLELWHWSRG